MIDEELLATCVSCGLCLPHCPTFRVTGREDRGPRGRIALMRALALEGVDPDRSVVEALDTCVGCRACEAVCPSGVAYGRLLAGARTHLRTRGVGPARWLRWGLGVLERPRLLRWAVDAARPAVWLGRRLGGRLRRRLPGIPPGPRRPLETTGGDAWLFTGCVMDAWLRPVHAATVAVLAAAGVGVEPTGDRVPCCGALAAHAGLEGRAARLIAHAAAALDDGRPVICNSAGCAAQLVEAGAAHGDLGDRITDVCEVLAASDLGPPDGRTLPVRVAVQDPCHLRWVLGRHDPVRRVLERFVEVVEIGDDGLCCGAGGAYSVTHPDEAAAIAARKRALVAETGAQLVAAANPGCMLHLATHLDVPVAHPVEIIDAALGGASARDPRLAPVAAAAHRGGGDRRPAPPTGAGPGSRATGRAPTPDGEAAGGR